MTIGEKIEVFGLKNFGSLKAFAAAVDKSPPDLSRYIGVNPKRLPGTPFLKKLYNLGCDMNWLFDEEEDKAKPSLASQLLEENNSLRKEVAELKRRLEQIEKIIK